MDIYKIDFMLMGSHEPIATLNLTWGEITTLSRGDLIAFDNDPIMYKIHSFAVNHGYPDGHIVLEKVTPKKIFKVGERRDQAD